MGEEKLPTEKDTHNSKNAGQVLGEELLKEVTGKGAKPPSRARRIWRTLAIPVLAMVTALIIGGLFIVFTTPAFYAAWAISPIAGLKEAWHILVTAYSALFTGAFGDPQKIMAALQSGNPELIRKAFYPFFESLVASTPYIFGGLSVALGFRAGLFNIGAEGQIFIGAIFSAFVGYAVTGLPFFIHMPLAFLAGAVGGGIWGMIPGWLKAKTGAHEVINTIMMNYIAFRLSDWLLTGLMKRPGSPNPVSPTIQESAKLFRFFGDPIRFHFGFFVALFMAWLVYWFLFKTRWGFDMRTVGSNPRAARYAGMSVSFIIVLAMTLAGALAGMAGANEVLGLNYNLAMAFSSGYGFDSIALALLGNNHPLGVVLSALLFGFLRNGATNMQLKADIPIDIISIFQALVLVFIATPAIIRTIWRLKAPAEGEAEGGITVTGWGGN
jgi:general nucleoside transport system permease protein